VLVGEKHRAPSCVSAGHVSNLGGEEQLWGSHKGGLVGGPGVRPDLSAVLLEDAASQL